MRVVRIKIKLTTTIQDKIRLRSSKFAEVSVLYLIKSFNLETEEYRATTLHDVSYIDVYIA